jgi:hypothetical protein
MSHESLPLDEVARRARWMVGSFKQEDIDRVPMHPTQGFEPLVSVVFDSLEFFCFLIPPTKSVEASVQDQSRGSGRSGGSTPLGGPEEGGEGRCQKALSPEDP